MKNEFPRNRIIATKVTQEEYEILEAIAQRINKKPYSLLYLMLQCVIKYGAEARPMGADMQRVLSIFNNFSKRKEKKRGTNTRTAQGAIYFLKDEADSTSAVMVQKYRETTRSAEAILAKVLETLFPNTARILRYLGASEENRAGRTYIEKIEELAGEALPHEEEKHLRLLFSDTMNDPFGNSLEPVKYVAHNRKSAKAIYAE